MDQQLQNRILEHGFIEAVEVQVQDIAITQDVRNACEQKSQFKPLALPNRAGRRRKQRTII